MVNLWGFKDFDLRVCRHEEELTVRRERNGSDSVSEVKVRDHDSLDHIDDQCKAIDIDADQSSLVWGQLETRYVASILEWHSLCDVGCKIEDIDLVTDRTQ